MSGTKQRPKAGGGRTAKKRQVVGWREWVGLPELGIEEIKAKIDTGARTSTLHAFDIVPVEENGQKFVRFRIHPVQRRRLPEVECTAPLVDRRTIRDSGGKTEYRYIVRTKLRIGERSWPIELTLTNRDEMSFRMLVGRAAIRKRFIVHPGTSFRTGRRQRRD
ncbi:MAG: ATP-dependent zinc protease [Alphaproteobacteria bacterium]|nr:ATP-dependent zinc protease [Alphaproteobacteria bacterium]